jgi:sugar-specific transcriptional regulator TrmB
MNIEAFGLTKTQFRVYEALVSLGPSTGYAVARRAGIARANAYDALDVLATRGFATATSGRPIRFSAASPRAFISIVSGEFGENLSRLATDLGVVESYSGSVEPASRLLGELCGSVEVFGAFRMALDSAKREALAVVGPWSQEVFEGLARGRERRIGMRVVSLGVPAPEGAVVRTVAESELREYWGGLPLALVVDRERALCAVERAGEWVGVEAAHPGLVPFIRHLLRREFASGTGAHV